MTQWIEIEGIGRYELVPPGSVLTLLQVARACKEVGLDPDALGKAIVDPDDGADRLLAMSVVIYAARLNAGEHHETVTAANDFPADGWTVTDDDPPEDRPDPTDGGDDSAGQSTP